MSRYRVTRWTQRHRLTVRLFHRIPPLRDLLSRLVWREIEADEEFTAGIAQGRADFAAGRWYSYDVETGETTRNPDWPESLA